LLASLLPGKRHCFLLWFVALPLLEMCVDNAVEYTPCRGQRTRIDRLAFQSEELAVEEFAVDDLKAIHKDGTLDPGWCACAQAQLSTPPHRLQWKLLEKVPKKCILGLGSNAQVWRSVHQRTGHHFAVKCLKQLAAQREIEVFEHLRANPHPFIVHLFLVQNFDEAEACCLVMENCAGGDLMKKARKGREDAEKKGRPYTAPALAQLWIGEMLLGLEYLHQEMDTLFRDLKPGNVLIDDKDQVKLADFGVSRLGSRSRGTWSFGCPTGSPAYIAPEILKQEPTDYKADMFSLGVVVWLILTGGLSAKREPQPPSNVRTMQDGQDYGALYDDWKLLQDVVRDESGTSALPVTGDAQDFVLHLIAESSAERLDHAAARAHPYLQSLSLPSVKTPAVLEWLHNLHADGTRFPASRKTRKSKSEKGHESAAKFAAEQDMQAASQEQLHAGGTVAGA